MFGLHTKYGGGMLGKIWLCIGIGLLFLEQLTSACWSVREGGTIEQCSRSVISFSHRSVTQDRIFVTEDGAYGTDCFVVAFFMYLFWGSSPHLIGGRKIETHSINVHTIRLFSQHKRTQIIIISQYTTSCCGSSWCGRFCCAARFCSRVVSAESSLWSATTKDFSFCLNWGLHLVCNNNSCCLFYDDDRCVTYPWYPW